MTTTASEHTAPATVAPAVLQADHITVQFGGLTAVNDVSFTVPERSVVSLIGPNGAGKTTFFNVLTGLYRPTAGNVVLNGSTVTGQPVHKIAAAGLARTERMNAQAQERITHAPSSTLVRARADQAVRAGALTAKDAADVEKFVSRAEGLAARDKASARATLMAKAGQLGAPGQAALAAELRRLAGSL